LAVLLSVATVLGPEAMAQEDEGPPSAYSDLWTGIYTGFGAYAGPVFLGNDEIVDSSGLAFGAKLRFSVVLHLLDVQLAYTHSFASGTLSGRPLEARNDSLSGSIGIHPLGAIMIFGPGLFRVLAASYVQFGWSAESLSTTWGSVEIESNWALGDHIGAGFDIPLDDLDDGQSVWVGFQYRYNHVPTALAPLQASDGEIDQHLLLLRASYRINALPF
jgi:hypothetical protein